MIRIVLVAGLAALLILPAWGQDGVDPDTATRIRQLITSLGADDWSERENATEALIALGRVTTPFLLTVRASTDDAEVERRVGRVLRATGGWVDDPAEIRRQIGGNLDSLHEEAIFEIQPWNVEEVHLIPGFEPMVEELKRIGPAVGQALVQALADPVATPIFRANLAFLLGKLEVADAVKPLVGCLEDADEYVRVAAARSLGALAAADAVGPLCARAVRETEPTVRQQLVLALVGMRVPEAVDGLIDLLEAEEAEVRQAAVYALGRLTGVSLRFNPYYPAERRARGVAEWRSWWGERSDSFVFPDPPQKDERAIRMRQQQLQFRRGVAPVPRQAIPRARRAVPPAQLQRVPVPVPVPSVPQPPQPPAEEAPDPPAVEPDDDGKGDPD